MDQTAKTTTDESLVGLDLGSSSIASADTWVDETELAKGQEPRFVRQRWPASPTIHVSLVIPAMNEGRNIGWVLERLPAVIDEVILVDGNSTDDTIAVSRAVRPDIRVIGQDRPGKGAALRAGFAAARGDVIVMIDADRSMDPAEIERFLALIGEGYDLVKGSRFMGDGGTTDMERIRRYGNAALRGLANSLYRTRFSDLCYGFMAFRRACRCGLRIGEVASFEQPRAHGESNLNTWRDGTRVLRVMLAHRFARERAREQPALVVAPEVAAAEMAPAMAEAF